MPKFPSFRPKDLEKILRKNGFTIKRQTGSHRIYYNSKSDRTAVIPFHSRELPQGTIRSIVKQSGLLEKTFLKK